MLRTFIVYNSILILTIIFSIFVSTSRNKTTEYISRTLLFLTQAIPAYIKEGIGTDYPNYVWMYKFYHHFDDDHEFVFRLLAKFLWQFDASPHTFIGILSVIPLFLIAYLVPKKNFGYFSIIYFLTTYFDVLSVKRQEVSIAFIAIGIIWLSTNKGTLKYLAASTMAFLFHASSALYYPYLLLRKIKIGPKTIYIVLFCMLFLMLGTDTIKWIFNNPIFLETKYSGYLDTSFVKQTKLGTGLGIVSNLILPGLFLLLNQRTSTYTKNSNLICWFAFSFIASYLLAAQVHIFNRLVTVFRFVPAFVAYPTCKTISKRYPYLVLCIFILGYTIIYEKSIFEAQISLGHGWGISPFKTIFD